jgi:hypothetical protein
MASGPRVIELAKVPDRRGNLTFVQGGRDVPFAIKRVYWIYDVPGGAVRGGHAYYGLEELIVALSGSFDVVIDDGHTRERFTLTRSYIGLYVPRLQWREVENFSTNSVCLVLASGPYEESDYIRDYESFRAQVGAARSR